MRTAIAAFLLAAPLLVGCGSSAEDPSGDVGETSQEALATSGGCNRTKVLASVSGARRSVLLRGFAWLDANVPYSQSRSHEGYRTDCSGFVSMCWQKGTSYTTADFVGGRGEAAALGSYNQLLPGDALVRQGHIMLFTGWADAAHSGVCALEEASTASDMQFRVHPVSSLRSQGYKALRSDDLGDVVAPPATKPQPAPPPVVDGPPPVDEPPSVDAPPPVELPPVADTPPPADAPPATEDPPSAPTDEPVSTSADPKKKSAAKSSPTPAGHASSFQFSDASDSGGCSIAHHGTSAPLGSIGLGLAALAWVRRRRASR